MLSAVRQSQATLTGGVQLDTDDDLAQFLRRTCLCSSALFFSIKRIAACCMGTRLNVTEVVHRDTQIKNESGYAGRRAQKRTLTFANWGSMGPDKIVDVKIFQARAARRITDK
jgi:hypothetical protein